MEGKVQGALRYLSCNMSGGVLKLNDLIPMTTDNGESCSQSTFDILKEKHPPGKPPDPECLLHPSSEPPSVHAILYDNLNADTILQAALHTQGSAGPAGLNAHAWKRMCFSFKSASHDLCKALAAVGRHIYAQLVASRLIPLDKCPGVRPLHWSR